MTLASYSKNLDSLFETPKDFPVSFTLDREKVRKEFVENHFTKEKILSEDVSKALHRSLRNPHHPACRGQISHGSSGYCQQDRLPGGHEDPFTGYHP